MEKQVLKPEYEEAIKKNHYLKADLAAANDCSTWTVDKWRKSKDPMLTSATCLAIIRKRLNLSNDIELTESMEMPEFVT